MSEDSQTLNEQQLYLNERVPIFPRSVRGRFRNIKTSILLLAYGIYFSLPWLPWQRTHGPDQTILFDIVNRRFYIFDLTVYAQDIFWLAGFLIIGAFLLFFVTGIAGRVFCGYFCFQTLWTDVFIFIERIVQGERNKRIKLANSPWHVRKVLLLCTTWLLWFVVSFWTGLSFTLYWGDANALLPAFFTGQAPFPAYATTLFLTMTTLVMAGLAREQVCTYMCPYARFQSVMFDKDTVIVSYDSIRGEREQGRLKPSKQNVAHDYREQEQIGDCIDCGYCVQVCPVGIDIRDGLQYECISCALCIDACNTVMDAAKYPRGLIRYSSCNHDEGKSVNRWLKAKTIGYALVLLLATTALIFNISSADKIEMHVKQNRQPLYILLSDGYVQNRYDIKIVNKYNDNRRLSLSLSGIEQARFDVKPQKEFDVAAGSSITINARVAIHPNNARGRTDELKFVLHDVVAGGTLVVPAQYYLPK